MLNDQGYQSRPLAEWMEAMKSGLVALPKFQRSYVWDTPKVKDLLSALLRGRPVGTLLIIADHPTRFSSRAIKGVGIQTQPWDPRRHLVLDGQQRLTALWSAFLGDPPLVVSVRDWSHTPLEALAVKTPTEAELPRDLTDIPATRLYEKICFPFSILGIDGVTQDVNACWKWCNEAVNNDGDRAMDLYTRINQGIGERLRGRNLWHLRLLDDLSRKDAIDVYVKTNQTSAVIKRFDIAVALYDADTGKSLREEIIEIVEDLTDGGLIGRFFESRTDEPLIPELGELLLKVASLWSDVAPTAGNYTKERVLTTLRGRLEEFRPALAWSLKFYTEEGIPDSRFVPSDVPLRVLPALYSISNENVVPGKFAGRVRRLLRAYLWRSFLTGRYSRSVNTRLQEDYEKLKAALTAIGSLTVDLKQVAPIFDEKRYPLPTREQMSALDEQPLPSPKLKRTISRGLFAVGLRQARDFATGRPFTVNDRGRWDYHHLFPKQYLRDNDVEERRREHCLNFALLTDKTNQLIRAQGPHEYLAEESALAKEVGGRKELRKLVETHRIPFDALARNGSKEVGDTYAEFIAKRSEVIVDDIRKLANGMIP